MTTTKQHKATHQGRMTRMLLFLLLMMAGAQGAWAAVTTVRGEVFYEQDYEAYGIGADWTTPTNGRHTPTILTEGGNHFMAANPTETYHNGATLTGPALNIAADKTYVLSFDLRLRKANNNSYKSEFWINNVAGEKFFSLTQGNNTEDGVWSVNGTTDVTLTGTQYENNAVVNDLHWFRFKLKWDGTNMTLEITDKGTDFSTSTSVLASTTITPLVEGKGIGNMSFYSGRAMSKFAIDNIRATTLFSYASEAANIDITEIGTADRLDLTSLFPGIVDEITGTVTETAYSSSDMTVMKPENTCNYLVGTGTTSIGYKKRIQNSADNYTDYKTSFDLTIYGSPATINSGTATNSSDNTKTDAWWELTSEGLTDASVEVGVVTMTSLFGTETGVSVKDPSNNNAYVLRVIDANGYTHTNLGSNTLHEDSYGGTFYRFDIAQSGKLQIWGTSAESAILLNDLSTSATVTATSTASGTSTWENLSAGTYYLYNTSLHSFTYTYATPKLKWSANSATVNIMDVGITNPNMVTGLPTLSLGTVDTTNSNDGYNYGYKSSNTSVARFHSWSDPGKLHICGLGTTTITVIDASSNTASYTLTVEGNAVNHTVSGGNTLSFDDEGVLPAGQQTVNLSTGLEITYGYTDETSIVTTYNDMTVLKIIDGNGYSHPNLTGNGTEGQPPSTIPWEGSAGGTFVKMKASKDGHLVVKGNVETGVTKLYRYTRGGDPEVTDVTSHIVFNTEEHTMSVSLDANAASGDYYYLYNSRPVPDDGTYISPVHSISFVPGFFAKQYEIIEFSNISTYEIQDVTGFVEPTYTIDGKVGDVDDGENALTIDVIDGKKYIKNVKGSGTIRIKATKGDDVAYYYLTVAYPATPYPGKIWDFNSETGIHSINDEPCITAVPSPTTTNGDWTAKYKNINNNREPRWFYNKAVAGDNAFVIAESAGLIFETSAGGFYMRNDGEIWHHVGIHRQKASFTIPLLKAGDIVELNWKRDAESSGANFSATNVKDLRGKSVDEIFNITGSRNKYRDGVNKDQGGLTSFEVAQDGDVKFTMEDTGYNDLLSVRIYSGGYQPTMSAINQYDGALGIPAPKTILLDNATQSVTLNYCNLLNSTATGPAMYVLKGYRSGSDNIECVTGTDSKKPGSNFSDDDAYPVSSAEQDFLYEQRKNLVGFRMYNDPWSSSNNSYNNGVIEATSGYGKVTVRMNNYTNDLKYVIGYTPDYTLTFGSAPHQKYPYTWNFENISGGAVKDNSNNAYNSVSTDYYTWDNYGNYRFGLNTDTDGGSLYVPGATLVSEDRELNNDEFAGLGFTGGLYIQTADGTDAVDEAIESTEEGNLLSFQMSSFSDATDYDNRYNTNIEAGAGHITFGGNNKYDTEYKASYKMDGNASSGGTKYCILRPKRPFRNGDIVKFKVFSKSASSGSDFGLTLYTSRGASAPSATLYIPAGTAKNTEVDLTYEITRGDGLAGLSELYVFRAIQKTTYLTEVYVTAPVGNRTAGVNYGKHITVPSSGSLTITVPDLNANSKQDWIYIKSSVAPSNITNATAAVAEDGLDAASGVYKYKVTDAGNSDITFPANATISSIGVTHILKPLKQVGDGDAWATESRDCAIDHTRTGFFTVNNIEAKYVTVAKYDIKYANVKLNDVGSYGVPKDIGLVLKMKMKYAAGDAGGAGGTMTAAEAETATSNAATNFAKTINYNSSDKTGDVPLFAPAISTNRLTTLGFNGTLGNMMMANLDTRLLTQERETGVIDKDGDAVDDSGAADGYFTRFIFADRYMKWTKIDNDVQHTDFTNSGNVPVFYRLHLYTTTQDGKTATQLNTLDANKAYLLIRSGNVPDALWKGQGTPAKRYIGIEGISDIYEFTDDSEEAERSKHQGIYNMQGQKIDEGSTLPAGIYIKDGRKVVVR